MKCLIRPIRDPHPELLTNELGLAGSVSRWHSRKEFETQKQHSLELLMLLAASDRLCLISEQGGREDSSYEVYELCSLSDENSCMGNISFTYAGSQHGKASLSARIAWKHIRRDMRECMLLFREIWETGAFDSLYCYDEDDFRLQNLTTTVGLEFYGIDESQVSIVDKVGVSVIDPSCNPGYFHNKNGEFTSIQWINFWSSDAQERIFHGPIPRQLPRETKLIDLKIGGVLLRLSDSPGRYDDEAFHLLQIECRRCLGLLNW